ncbi:MAG: LiaI-LiaF-like domain-containing protein [Acidobacteriota bacterium]
MNCYQHPDVAAVAFCRTCGRPLCQDCQRSVQGTVVCEEHAPRQIVAAPPVARVNSDVSPGLAFVLGLIPGVGAIYNGQYAKGVVHVVIFGLLISIAGSGSVSGLEPLFGFLIAIWYFYMPFEAYHTARKRQLGEPVDEFSSVFPMRTRHRGLPIGPLVLIALGVIFLLNTMDVLRFDQIIRWWPVALIGLGAYMLYCRFWDGGADRNSDPNLPGSFPGEEAQHEQR